MHGECRPPIEKTISLNEIGFKIGIQKVAIETSGIPHDGTFVTTQLPRVAYSPSELVSSMQTSSLKSFIAKMEPPRPRGGVLL